MRETGFWSRGTSSFREDKPMESRSRYEENDRPNYESRSRTYGPSPSDNDYRNSNFNNNSRPIQEDMRDNRYGNNQGRMGPPPHSDNMGPPPHSDNMGPPRGPMMGGGPPVGGDMGNRPPMGPPHGNPGMGPMGGGGYGNPEPDLYSSIQTLSHMNAQQNDIASKIISAVLSTNIMGSQQGPPQFPHGEMGGGYEEQKPFVPPRSRSMRGGGSRTFVPSDRFSRERRARSPKVSFSGFGGEFNRSVDRHTDSRNRSSDLRGRLTPKRSWSTTSRDDNSNFKRRRGGSQDRSGYSGRKDKERESRQHGNRNKSNDEHDTEKELKSEDDAGTEKKALDHIPVGALYCHMCKQGNFTSVMTYLFHLEGIRHSKIASAFHSKNESTLDYLRKNAKLGSIRFGGMDNFVTPSRCSICSALVKESFYKHKKLLEHRVVKKFLKPKCCGRYFKTRYDMDEHRLSLPHLGKIYQANEDQHLLLDDSAKGGRAMWTFEDAVKHLKSKNPMEADVGDLTWDNVPPFDGNSFIGIDLLEAKKAVLCVPCKIPLEIGIKTLESHLTSMDHYHSVNGYLREKKRKPAAESEDAPASGETPEKFNRGEGKDYEDEDDDDDDAVGVEIKDNEEEEEEGAKMPYIDESEHIMLEEIGLDMEDPAPVDNLDMDQNEELEAEMENEIN